MVLKLFGRGAPFVLVVISAGAFSSLGGAIVGEEQLVANGPSDLFASTKSPVPVKSIRTAQRLADQSGSVLPNELEDVIDLAKDARKGQAEILGLSWIHQPRFVGPASPGESLLKLVRLYYPSIPPGVHDDAAELDSLEEPLRGSIAHFLEVFMAYAHEVSAAYEGLRSPLIPTMEDHDPADDAGLSDYAVAPDYARVFSFQMAMLEAIAELYRATTSMPEQERSASCVPISDELLYAFEFGCSNTYVQDVMLLVDFAGDDTYLNNAGGFSSIEDFGLGLVGDCNSHPSPPWSLFAPVAVLVDLAGDDQYGNQSAPRSCGVNGGGVLGSGFLFDGFGNDEYFAASYGTNGGAYLAGIGLLLDAFGDDRYNDCCSAWWLGRSHGVNGGGDGGIGFLMDGFGHDLYSGASYGVNGGAYADAGILGPIHFIPRTAASGFLFDVAGDDYFGANLLGANGGSYTRVTGLSNGFLLDASGNDVYGGDDCASRAVGFLADWIGCATGVNGAHVSCSYDTILRRTCDYSTGSALLFDGGGLDLYSSRQNGFVGADDLYPGELGPFHPQLSEVNHCSPVAGVMPSWITHESPGETCYRCPALIDVEGWLHCESHWLLDQWDSGIRSCKFTIGDCSVIPKGLSGSQIDVPISPALYSLVPSLDLNDVVVGGP